MLSNKDKFQRFEIEQFIAMGFLLGFENVSTVDLGILIELFIKGRNINIGSKFANINSYVEFQEDGCILKNGRTIYSYVPEVETSVRTQLEKIAGIDIIKYAQQFSMEEFLLRKIEKYGSIHEEKITDVFCKTQLEELKAMATKGYVTYKWNDDVPHDDYHELQLSQKGLLQLFKLNYGEEIKNFKGILKALRYDETLLDDFLLAQNLSLPVAFVLKIENFDQFCSTYDRVKTIG